MNRFFLFLLPFISILSLQSLASTITVQKGDTLSKIASENNITIKEIMDANNITDANQIKEGQKLNIPIKSNEYKIHIVKKGENLNQISNLYDIKKEDLIKANEIINPNYLLENQKLNIPIVKLSSEEEGSNISDKENLNEGILSLENTKNLSEGKESSNWKTYGPLKINWSSWKMNDKSFIANTMHKSGKPLLIAINCHKKIINRTGRNGVWRDWISPKDGFEKDLLNDVCKKKVF